MVHPLLFEYVTFKWEILFYYFYLMSVFRVSECFGHVFYSFSKRSKLFAEICGHSEHRTLDPGYFPFQASHILSTHESFYSYDNTVLIFCGWTDGERWGSLSWVDLCVKELHLVALCGHNKNWFSEFRMWKLGLNWQTLDLLSVEFTPFTVFGTWSLFFFSFQRASMTP